MIAIKGKFHNGQIELHDVPFTEDREVIVTFLDSDIHASDTVSGKGFGTLSRYANPALITSEKTAWKNAAGGGI